MFFWDYIRPGHLFKLDASSEMIHNNYTNSNQNTRASNNRGAVLIVEVDLTVRYEKTSPDVSVVIPGKSVSHTSRQQEPQLPAQQADGRGNVLPAMSF